MEKKTEITPTRTNILVEPIETKTSNLIMPDTAKKDNASFQFIIRKIGCDVKKLEVGMDVIFPLNLGHYVVDEKKEYLILDENQIIAFKA